MRVTEVKDFVTADLPLADTEKPPREIADLGTVDTHHGSGAKRGRPRKDAKAAA